MHERLKNILALTLIGVAGVGAGYIGHDMVNEKTINNVNVEVPEQNTSVEVSSDPSIRAVVQEKGNDWVPGNRPGADYSGVTGGVEVSNIDFLYSVDGGSMRPAFWSGNTLLGEEFDSDDSLQSGTVVATESGVVHLVEHFYPESGEAVLKGYNSRKEETVQVSEIEGKIIGVLYTNDRSSEVSRNAEAR